MTARYAGAFHFRADTIALARHFRTPETPGLRIVERLFRVNDLVRMSRNWFQARGRGGRRLPRAENGAAIKSSIGTPREVIESEP